MGKFPFLCGCTVRRLVASDRRPSEEPIFLVIMSEVSHPRHYAPICPVGGAKITTAQEVPPVPPPMPTSKRCCSCSSMYPDVHPPRSSGKPPAPSLPEPLHPSTE